MQRIFYVKNHKDYYKCFCSVFACQLSEYIARVCLVKAQMLRFWIKKYRKILEIYVEFPIYNIYIDRCLKFMYSTIGCISFSTLLFFALIILVCFFDFFFFISKFLDHRTKKNAMCWYIYFCQFLCLLTFFVGDKISTDNLSLFYKILC